MPGKAAKGRGGYDTSEANGHWERVINAKVNWPCSANVIGTL